MGLLQAGIGALSGVLADQWRDYFYCDSLECDILAAKGVKRAGRKSSNKHGSDNIISNGSIIAVNEGQCMIIVEQGKIVEMCAQPGEFVFDTSSEPSIFFGDMDEQIGKSFETLKKRFAFGGDTGNDQRIYFFNTKEITGNRYGTANPVPFRVVDNNIGLDVDISIRCHGEYSYKIVDPILFYTNVCGNFDNEFDRENIDSQLKTELMTALQPAFAKISEMGIRYSALPGHTTEIADALNGVLSEKWRNLRGIQIVSFGVSSVNASEENEKMIKELQRNAAFRNPSMAAAHLTGAQAQAMQDAAKNPNGAMNGFFGMNMAQNAGGANAANLYAMGQQQAQNQSAPNDNNTGWKCACGASGNTGKFCSECGAKKPVDEVWLCKCGNQNTGKFCSQCGSPKPNVIKCSICGKEFNLSSSTPKFCPECGNKL